MECSCFKVNFPLERGFHCWSAGECTQTKIARERATSDRFGSGELEVCKAHPFLHVAKFRVLFLLRLHNRVACTNSAD